jgi:hypothetical protein
MAARVAKQAARASGTAALCWLLELPEELLLRVLQHLGMAALQAAGSACAALRRAGAGPELVEAAARGGGEFWASLAFDEPARSRIGHLRPRPAGGGPPTIGALRRFFSGTQPVARDVGEMFFCGTVERGGGVVATFGPIDADLMETDIAVSRNYDFAAMSFHLYWKSLAVKKEYSDDDAPGWPNETLLKKSVTVRLHAVTDFGTYLVCREVMRAGWHQNDVALHLADLDMYTNETNIIAPAPCLNLNRVRFIFQVVDKEFESFDFRDKREGCQQGAIFPQVAPLFRPTCRSTRAGLGAWPFLTRPSERA